jgi:hypothetical protein
MTNEQHLELVFEEQISRLVASINNVAHQVSKLNEDSYDNADHIVNALNKLGLNGASTSLGALELVAKELEEIKEKII